MTRLDGDLAGDAVGLSNETDEKERLAVSRRTRTDHALAARGGGRAPTNARMRADRAAVAADQAAAVALRDGDLVDERAALDRSR